MRAREMATESIEHYSHDCARCPCEPTHNFHGVPCISVTRTIVTGPGWTEKRDRCTGCGRLWWGADYRWQMKGARP